MRKSPGTLLLIQVSGILLVACPNLAILGIILAGFSMSQDIAGGPLGFGAFAIGNFLLAGYLGLRFRGASLQLRGDESFPIYPAAMLLSLLIPFSVFFLVRHQEALVELGPMVFAQSLFMTTAIGIKMHARKYVLY